MMKCYDETTPSRRADRRQDALGDFRVLDDETLCSILYYLSPRDVARLGCVSSVMYIFCNEEPLWMNLCLRRAKGLLQYKNSWKKTALHLENVPQDPHETFRKALHFEGFSSLFLYKRLYRCHTTLHGFSFDDGNVERKKDLSLDEFSKEYDARKPVLISGLADSWSARVTWTVDQLMLRYGDTAFKLSQRGAGKILMNLKDYVSYMNIQHDEDPLYVFDDKFGEAAPDLLQDYIVPHIFQEDWFDILDKESRPPFRWLIIGPERSGASWHVDPALTSAWNTLLCGRKRWALYPPGRVPLGVTVHVNEEDGDVNIDTPSSLQWWLDYYPLLADEDKPIECTQQPGETIYVPSGWWHCVLNLETTIAVTQNFVNEKNFEFVCLDLAPGYRHKGVCRAGLLALDEGSLEDFENSSLSNDEDEDGLSYSDKGGEERKLINKPGENVKENVTNGVITKRYHMWKQGFSYDADFLSTFLDKEKDHYSSSWNLGNPIGQREMRQWLSKLWNLKLERRELIWKGACLSLNAEKWLECLHEICVFHNMPSVTDDEKLPVGTGSNPVYLFSDYVVKVFVEGGLETSMYGLGSELEFYNTMHKVNSPLKSHVPEVLASGIIFFEGASYKIEHWDGKRIPEVLANSNLHLDAMGESEFPFGIWSKQLFVYRNSDNPEHENIGSSTSSQIWPFIITNRCKGNIFAQLRDEMSWEDALNLSAFLGEQMRNLHLLPYPSMKHANMLDAVPEAEESSSPAEWQIFVKTLSKKKKDVVSRLNQWGNPIPQRLMDKIDEYIPDDFFRNLLNLYENRECSVKIKPCSWIHSDIMDDNIHMEATSNETANGVCTDERKSWRPGHILDFGNLSIGDPICELIPLYLDVFRGDSDLLKHFLESYKLPLVRSLSEDEYMDNSNRIHRLSYRAMCYCILHDDNVLGAIFSLWDELGQTETWEEVEQTVWRDLNNYKSSY